MILLPELGIKIMLCHNCFLFPESAFREKKTVKGVDVLATTGEFSPSLHYGMGIQTAERDFSTSLTEFPIGTARIM